MYYSPAIDPNKKLTSLFKLVCLITGEEKKEEGESHLKVLGAHAIGKSVDEMMQMVSVCLNMGATK